MLHIENNGLNSVVELNREISTFVWFATVWFATGVPVDADLHRKKSRLLYMSDICQYQTLMMYESFN